MRLVWAQYALDDRLPSSLTLKHEPEGGGSRRRGEIARAVRRLLDFPESGRRGQ